MTILHPTDFSECAEQARAYAIRMAQALGAEVILLHVSVEVPLYREGFASMRDVERVFEAQREWAMQTLEQRAAEMRATGVPTRTWVVPGVPAQEIVKAAAEEGVDLIVMGTLGRSAFERFFLGSVADRVIRAAPCPVATVRESTTA